MAYNKITPKQEAFARACVDARNASEAYRRAYNASGMKPASIEQVACRLLENPKVASRVTELQDQAGNRNDLSVDWVLPMLKENAERAMQVRPVLDIRGQATGEYSWDGNVANRALELIGKHLGMFVEKRELSVQSSPIEIIHRSMAGVTDQELQALIALKTEYEAEREDNHGQ